MSQDWKRKLGLTLRYLGYPSYVAYLGSDSWKMVRAEYRGSRLVQKCLWCGTRPFDLHHRTYERLGRELLMDLVPLCRDCHHKVHETRGASIRSVILSCQIWNRLSFQDTLPMRRRCNLIGSRWHPRSKSDLIRMQIRLGNSSCAKQHDRILGGCLPNYLELTKRAARGYCLALTEKTVPPEVMKNFLKSKVSAPKVAVPKTRKIVGGWYNDMVLSDPQPVVISSEDP